MAHEWIDHTGELELRLEAPSVQAVFEEGLRALGELLAERASQGGQRAHAGLVASAPDRATLLAEWLNELVYLAESKGIVPESVEWRELSETALDAEVSGRRAFPSHLVKAVTYHRLELKEEGATWRGRAVLDV